MIGRMFRDLIAKIFNFARKFISEIDTGISGMEDPVRDTKEKRCSDRESKLPRKYATKFQAAVHAIERCTQFIS